MRDSVLNALTKCSKKHDFITVDLARVEYKFVPGDSTSTRAPAPTTWAAVEQTFGNDGHPQGGPNQRKSVRARAYPVARYGSSPPKIFSLLIILFPFRTCDMSGSTPSRVLRDSSGSSKMSKAGTSGAASQAVFNPAMPPPTPHLAPASNQTTPLTGGGWPPPPVLASGSTRRTSFHRHRPPQHSWLRTSGLRQLTNGLQQLTSGLRKPWTSLLC